MDINKLSDRAIKPKKSETSKQEFLNLTQVKKKLIEN